MDILAALSSEGGLVGTILWLTGGALVFFVLWFLLYSWKAPPPPMVPVKTVLTVLLYVFGAIILILFICRVTGFNFNL